MNTRKIVLLSLLTTIALTIFVIEAQIPPVVPFPGIKPGLSNIITLVTLVWFGRKEAFIVLLLRIFLGNIFAGQAISFIYSFTGGIFSYIIISALFAILKNQPWVLSVFGAVFHNIGQIAAAIIITGVREIAGYFMILMISAIITGAFTGLTAERLTKHIHI